MVLAEQTNIETISLTPAAAKAVQDLLAKRELEGYALRVYIQGGGCSGFQYGMALDNNFRDEDNVTDCHGVQVVVDDVSIQYMRGASIDFVEDAMGSGFKVDNPNAFASCGCGPNDSAASQGGGCSGCG